MGRLASQALAGEAKPVLPAAILVHTGADFHNCGITEGPDPCRVNQVTIPEGQTPESWTETRSSFFDSSMA